MAGVVDHMGMSGVSLSEALPDSMADSATRMGSHANRPCLWPARTVLMLYDYVSRQRVGGLVPAAEGWPAMLRL
jgi:hypothetical protein